MAKQFQLFRLKGDLASAPLKEAQGSDNIAEEFNYTPEMVLAGPMLPDKDIQPVVTGERPIYDSILSLPPVF